MKKPYGIVRYVVNNKYQWYIAEDSFSYFAVLSELFVTENTTENQFFLAFIL